MEGVTTAIVLFIFVCVLFPRLIDNRAQYYIAFVATLLIILLDAGKRLIAVPDGSAMNFAIIATAILQVVAILLLFLSAGGLTVRGLTKDMIGAFEVIRRGETQKEIIIPIGDQFEKKEHKRAIDTIGQPQERFDLTSEAESGVAYPQKPSAGPPGRKPEDGPIPMD